MTNSLADLEHSRCILVIGSNTTECHPLVARRLMRAKANGATLLVADPRRTHLAHMAHMAVQPQPGSDVALLNAMAAVIVREELYDASLETTTEGFAELRRFLQGVSLEEAAATTGIPSDAIEKFALLYARTKPAALCYAMGITQYAGGTERVQACSNLALLTGNIGVAGGGINPLRGQNNVQGACDMGGLPDVLPGYNKVANADSRLRAEGVWGGTLPAEPGIPLTRLPQAILDGKIRALYVIGENPLLSDPDVGHLQEALTKLSFLVVQDIFPTRTAEAAHVVLPAAASPEKEGTFTNTERRCSRLNKAVPPPGQALSDGEILCLLAERMGHPWHWRGAEAVFDEMRSITPSYAGMTYARIGVTGLQWPCPAEDHPGTPLLHVHGPVRGKGKFFVVSPRGPAEPTDTAYPLALSTGRNFAHYHTATMTGVSPALAREGGKAYVEMHPDDASSSSLVDGQQVRLVTRRGAITAMLRITPGIRRGVVFMPFHYELSPANRLTQTRLDPACGIPELKHCAVRVEHA